MLLGKGALSSFPFWSGLVVMMLFVPGQALMQNVAPEPGAEKSTAAWRDGRRDLVPNRWWEKAGSICTVLVKSLPPDEHGRPATRPSFDPKDEDQARAFFTALKAKGCDALLFDNPAETGGRVYSHLAIKDHYKVAPDIGSLENFRRLVRLAHTMNLPVIIDYGRERSSRKCRRRERDSYGSARF